MLVLIGCEESQVVCKAFRDAGHKAYSCDLPPTRCLLIWDKGAGFKGRNFAEYEAAWTNLDTVGRQFTYDPLARGDYKGNKKIREGRDGIKKTCGKPLGMKCPDCPLFENCPHFAPEKKTK